MLGITIWKARPVHVQGVKLGVKCTMVSILMRDGMYGATENIFLGDILIVCINYGAQISGVLYFG